MNELMHLSQNIQTCFSYACTITTMTIDLKLSLGLHDAKDKHKKLITTMINLKAECLYNQKDRGNQQKPYVLDRLRKALESTEFRERYPTIFDECLKIHQLALDANLGNFRKLDNGVLMVTGHIQDMMTEIFKNLETIIPNLSNQSEKFRFLPT